MGKEVHLIAFDDLQINTNLTLKDLFYSTTKDYKIFKMKKKKTHVDVLNNMLKHM